MWRHLKNCYRKAVCYFKPSSTGRTRPKTYFWITQVIWKVWFHAYCNQGLKISWIRSAHSWSRLSRFTGLGRALCRVRQLQYPFLIHWLRHIVYYCRSSAGLERPSCSLKEKCWMCIESVLPAALSSIFRVLPLAVPLTRFYCSDDFLW